MRDARSLQISPCTWRLTYIKLMQCQMALCPRRKTGGLRKHFMTSRAEVGDGVEDSNVGGAADMMPKGAVAQAQEKEQARVTLYRTLKTIVRMLDARGYDIIMMGFNSVSTREQVLLELEQYKIPERALAAETTHEIILEAVVKRPACKFSTAWASDLPSDHKLIVVAIDQGNVETMREIDNAMIQIEVQSAVLISRRDLTAYSKKFLADPLNTKGSIQHFQYYELQAAIIDHSMVPEHLPLNDAMRTSVMTRYAGAKFPRLLLHDPMVRFLGLKPGMVVAVREVFGREQAVMTYFEVCES